MTQYIIEIDDSAITEQINTILNTIIKREMAWKYSNVDQVVRESVKEIVYTQKDEIINRVVERATREIVKKGWPKLIDRFDSEGK